LNENEQCNGIYPSGGLTWKIIESVRLKNCEKAVSEFAWPPERGEESSTENVARVEKLIAINP
jgi:hypothetical protein